MILDSGIFPGGGNGNPLQYFCLNNHMDRGSWWAIVHGLTSSQTLLTNCACTNEVSYIRCVSLFQSPKGDPCRRPFSSVQLLSHVQHFETPWTAVHQASLSIINSWSLLKLMSIEAVMPSNHLILCHPLLLLPSIFPSIRSFQMSQFFASAAKILELQYQSFQGIFRTDHI